MKKRAWLPLLAAVLLLNAPARADWIGEQVLGLLTEVYGYTQAESETFTIEADGSRVRFWPAGHPQWVYTADFDGQTLQNSASPFAPDKGGAYPGEATVRAGMRLLREEWLPAWNDESRAQMQAWMREWNVYPVPALRDGLALGTLCPQEAVRTFLLSCYGELSLCAPALREWEQETLGALALAAQMPAVGIPAPGVVRWEAEMRDGRHSFVRFAGQVPEELAQAFDTPRLQGWTLLCGALDKPPLSGARQTGLAAFGMGERRLLVALREPEDGKWQLDSLGEDSLQANRDFWIEPGRRSASFDIVYPVSDVEKEWFSVFCSSHGEDELNCRLLGYTRRNEATGAGVQADEQCITVAAASGKRREQTRTRPLCMDLRLVSLGAFPTTPAQYGQAKPLDLPEGYACVSGVHLRARKSSRSKDLGNYNGGALVRVLGRESGDPYDWYLVRVGSAQGYMSSAYVRFADEDDFVCPVLPTGEAAEEIKLRDGTGWFAKTIQKVPAGTRMHILAECGGWLHVTIPRGEIGPLMDVSGTDGYVRAGQIRRVRLTDLGQ